MRWRTRALPDGAASRANVWLAAIVAAFVPFAIVACTMLFHFYVRGAFVQDSGLLGALIWHGDARLTLPDSQGGFSYLSIHFSPILIPLALASWEVPLSLPQWFAGLMGLSHALLAIAVFWVLTQRFGLTRGWRVWLAAVLAACFALSGLALAILRFPHFEILIPAFFLLFCAARTAGRPRLALTFFILGLLTREDAGLHYGVLLLLSAAWQWRRGEVPRDLPYALAAMAYVALAVGVQHIVFPRDFAFGRIYIGDPPLAHLSWERLRGNLLNLLINRPYVILPAIVAGFWAARTRDPMPLLGFVAAIPWVGMQLLAASLLASRLASYYAFPFVIAIAWPLFTVAPSRTTPIWFAMMLAVTFVPAIDPHNPGRLFLPEAVSNTPTFERQGRIDAAVAALVAARPALGILVVDNSVAALDPRAFSSRELPDGDVGTPDTVIWFADGYDSDRLRRFDDLGARYAMPGTPIRLVSRLPIRDVAALRDRIVPAP